MAEWFSNSIATMPGEFKLFLAYFLGVLSYHLCSRLYNNHLTLKYIKKEPGSDSVVVVSVKRWNKNAIEHFTSLGYERSNRHS